MIAEAVQFLQSQTALRPRVAVVLGSGLGAFAEELADRTEIPYAEIPGWPCSTAIGHAGKLVFGKLDTLDVAVMAGRVHLYEGYTAGGINLALERGGLVLLSDHINLQGSNPLVGPNDDTLGTRFPDMSEAYSRSLRALAHELGSEIGIRLAEGVYAAVLGPSYETPAEIRYLRAIGADLVGMSTVPETIAANHVGMRVLGISCVTNMAAGILPQKISHAEVLEAGEMVRGTLVKFLRALLPRMEI